MLFVSMERFMQRSLTVCALALMTLFVAHLNAARLTEEAERFLEKYAAEDLRLGERVLSKEAAKLEQTLETMIEQFGTNLARVSENTFVELYQVLEKAEGIETPAVRNLIAQKIVEKLELNQKALQNIFGIIETDASSRNAFIKDFKQLAQTLGFSATLQSDFANDLLALMQAIATKPTTLLEALDENSSFLVENFPLIAGTAGAGSLVFTAGVALAGLAYEAHESTPTPKVPATTTTQKPKAPSFGMSL